MVCEGEAEDFVAEEENVVCVEMEEEDDVTAPVTAVDPTLKVVERRLGAGSLN